MSLRIGSLCTGVGGLEMAVTTVLPDAEVAWHAQYEPPDKNGKPDVHQYPSQILAHRYPGVPNHGDILTADWFEAEPIDILTAGYPCQPISWAGLGKVTEDARWIWPAVAQGIRLLRPRLVFLENVAAHVVRGLPDVIADLAKLGYVGSWLCLRASDIGAPHQRKRLFILARPADADANRAARRLGLKRSGSRTVQGTEIAERAAQQSGRLHCGGRSTISMASDALGSGAAAAYADRPALGTQCHGEPSQQEADDRRHRVDASGRFLGWGPYAEAVGRWERTLGRHAPVPVDERGRLAPPFVEWMMGLPAGWVTDVPGIPRSAQLKALGNGVVPQQAAEALRVLIDRMCLPVADAAPATSAVAPTFLTPLPLFEETPVGPSVNLPLGATRSWRAVVETRAKLQCECTGQCGVAHKQAAGRCPRKHEGWHNKRTTVLVLAPKSPNVSLHVAANLPDGQLMAWCPDCLRKAEKLLATP